MQFLIILHIVFVIACLFGFVLTIYSDEGTLLDVIVSFICSVLGSAAFYYEGMTAFVIGIILATALGISSFIAFFGKNTDHSGIIHAPLCVLYIMALTQYTI